MEVVGQSHATVASPPRKQEPVSTEWWMGGPHAGLDALQEDLLPLPTIGPRLVGRPAQNLLLVQLSTPFHPKHDTNLVTSYYMLPRKVPLNRDILGNYVRIV